jgi:hypothetical protein
VSDELTARKKMTFAQAEGVDALPSQLQLREISAQLRAVLWHRVNGLLDKSTKASDYSGSYLTKPWSTILEEIHVYRELLMSDDFNNDAPKLIKGVRAIFEKGDYIDIFGWLEFVLKHPACPSDFAAQIEDILRFCRAAYRVLDRSVICPVASDAEHSTIVRAFADLAAKEFNGARSHLRSAATHLTAGAFADSVRESIHSVESVCRTLDPSAELSRALARLEQSIAIHPAMKRGFTSLYGYASDENGIRHALLENGKANVDEADALFMLGACAAFVSYMINKSRVRKSGSA